MRHFFIMLLYCDCRPAIESALLFLYQREERRYYKRSYLFLFHYPMMFDEDILILLLGAALFSLFKIIDPLFQFLDFFLVPHSFINQI